MPHIRRGKRVYDLFTCFCQRCSPHSSIPFLSFSLSLQTTSHPFVLPCSTFKNTSSLYFCHFLFFQLVYLLSPHSSLLFPITEIFPCFEFSSLAAAYVYVTQLCGFPMPVSLIPPHPFFLMPCYLVSVVHLHFLVRMFSSVILF